MAKALFHGALLIFLMSETIGYHKISAGTTTSTGGLSVDEVSDGPCLGVTELFPHLYSGVNLRPILTSGTYYIPMASKALYRQYAEGLLGRPATSQRELDSMQLVLKCGPLFSTIENIGFPYLDNPPRFSQTCVSAGIPSFADLGIFRGEFNVDSIQAICIGLPPVRPKGDFALHASPSFASTMDSIIWVNDDYTVLLTYRCPADGLKDFKVVSKTKVLKPIDVDIIRAKVAELGFPEDHIAFMNYNLGQRLEQLELDNNLI